MQIKLILTIIATALAALAVTAPSAQAADMGPPIYKAPPYAAPVYGIWSGFYVGVNGGYGFGSSDWDFPAVSADPEGGLVGGTIGYNMQTGPWVFGLEGDFDWADMKGNTNCVIGVCQTKTDWFATARGRIGYAGWSNAMIYFTGGGAFADVKGSSTAFADTSKTMAGWTVGGGVEYAFAGNWSAKVEYLYSDLGSFDCAAACGFVAPDEISYTTNMVRGGINYRF
jgi:outer membrane immunogenic protein